MALYEGHGIDGGAPLPAGGAGEMELDFSDDEMLLDWEQYAGMRRTRLCGCECTAALPFLSSLPPSWWYRYSMRQRRLLLSICGCCSCSVATVLILMAIFWSSSGALQRQASPPAAAQLPELCGWTGFRLPEVFVPETYTLEFNLSGLDAAPQQPVTVEGSVVIDITALGAFRCLPLHAALDSMDITSASVGAVAGTVERSPGFATSGIVLLEVPRELAAGQHRVALRFRYPLVASLSGLYMSSFTDSEGAAQVLAVTQFESTSARQAFPCFDEPAMKAAFQVSVVAPAGMQVLGNMPAAGVEPAGAGLRRHAFATTPAMSTYLVALVAGQLERVSAQVPGTLTIPRAPSPPRTISVWGVPGRSSAHLAAALDFAVSSLQRYEAVFGFAYALPKMDLVAIPDFAAGAMENWGLITFRETDLLVNEAEDSVASLRRVALVVAHEIAHQWTGNLVTAAFWNDLWLNEGFASYFEYVGAAAALPEMNVWDNFFADVTASAMEHDARRGSTMPLSSSADRVHSTAQIESFFNAAAYDKGAAVLRMLREYMARHQDPGQLEGGTSDDPFMAAVAAYLRKRQYTAASSADLIDDLQGFMAASGDAQAGDLAVMLHKWVYDTSVPRVEVSLAGPGETEVSIRQASLTAPGSNCSDSAPPENDAAPWHVPIRYVGRGGDSQWRLLASCGAEHLYTLQGEDDWLKLNEAQRGLYSVSYALPLWGRLVRAAGQRGASGAPVLGGADVAGLLHDAYFQATYGITPITVFLQLLNTLPSRPLELPPWLVAHDSLAAMRLLLPPTGACGLQLQSFVREKLLAGYLSPALMGDTQGSAEGPALSLAPLNEAKAGDLAFRSVRQVLLSLAGRFNNTALQAEATQLLLQTSPSNQGSVPGDVRSLVFRMAASSGLRGWELVRQAYLTSGSATEQAQAMHALAYASDATLLQRTLELAISRDVRPQDRVALIRSVAARGGEALEAAWRFVTSRWADIGAAFASPEEKSRQLGRLLGAAGGFSDQRRLDEVASFWASTAAADVGEEYYLNSATEMIQEHMAWLQQNMPAACEWLASAE